VALRPCLVARGLEPQELRDDGAPGLALAHDASRTVPGDVSGLLRSGIPAVGEHHVMAVTVLDVSVAVEDMPVGGALDGRICYQLILGESRLEELQKGHGILPGVRQCQRTGVTLMLSAGLRPIHVAVAGGRSFERCPGSGCVLSYSSRRSMSARIMYADMILIMAASESGAYAAAGRLSGWWRRASWRKALAISVRDAVRDTPSSR
jgi:hypothetical protein